MVLTLETWEHDEDKAMHVGHVGHFSQEGI